MLSKQINLAYNDFLDFYQSMFSKIGHSKVKLPKKILKHFLALGSALNIVKEISKEDWFKHGGHSTYKLTIEMAEGIFLEHMRDSLLARGPKVSLDQIQQCYRVLEVADSYLRRG